MNHASHRSKVQQCVRGAALTAVVALASVPVGLWVWVKPDLEFSSYDKEKANQQLRIRASNFNYKNALEQQRATETDPERLKELQAEIERLP